MKLALLAILAAACSAKQESTEPAAPPAEETPEPPVLSDQKLRVTVDVEPAHLNPILLPDRCDQWCFRIAQGLVYEPLFVVDDDGTPKPGGLAVAVEANEERTVLDVEIRPGAKWHDGRAVLAADVAFTYGAILDPQNGLSALRRDLIDLHVVELSASRPMHVRVRFVRPNSFMTSVMSEVPILPGHIFRSETGMIDWPRHQATRRPIGSGPYRFAEWKRGDRIVLRRVDEQAAPSAPAEIVFLIQPDGAEALGQLRRDEVDILSRILPIHYPDEALTPLTESRFREVRLRPARYALLLLNVKRAPLSDVRVRKALAHLVDREAIVRDVRRGLGHPIGVPGVDESIEPLPVDAAAAARLLDEAGLLRKGKEPDSPRRLGRRLWRLDLLSVARAPLAEEQAKRIAAGFEEQGITSSPRLVESRDLLGRLRKGDFDAAVVTFTGRADIDLAPLLGTGGVFNYGGFSDAVVDAALEALKRRPPGDNRDSARLELGRRLKEMQPVIFLYAVEEVALVRRGLDGLAPLGGWLDLSRVSFAVADAPPGPAVAVDGSADAVR